ncbi:MAG: dodecin family protein [Candidatus Heimdallarchaeaceae archaeon]
MENFGGDYISVAKIIEVVGSSEKSWEDAINQALKRASKTVRNIRGVDVIGQKGIVKNGEIVEYRVVLKLSFGVE